MPRLLLIHVAHETNTFSRLKTDLPAFARRYLHVGDEAVAKAMQGTRSEMGGFLDAAAEYGWQVRHPISAAATPSGTVTAEAWAALTRPVMETLDEPFDGILIAFHGAMVAEGRTTPRASCWAGSGPRSAPGCRSPSPSTCTPTSRTRCAGTPTSSSPIAPIRTSTSTSAPSRRPG